MDSSNKKPLFWVILVVGVIAVTSFSWLVGSFAGKLWNKGREAAVERGEIPSKSDVNAREKSIQKADTFDNNTGKKNNDSDSNRDRSGDRDREDSSDRDLRLPDQNTTIENPDNTLGTQQSPTDTDTNRPDTTPATIEDKPAPADNPATNSDKPDTKPAPAPGPSTSSGSKFRVQIGSSISDASKADTMAGEASAKTGLNCSKVKNSNSTYRVQCGVFSQKDKATTVASNLKGKGYSVYVAETK